MRSGKVESFASSDEIAPIIPYLPDKALPKVEMDANSRGLNAVGAMPIDVAAPIVKRLAQLEQDISAFRRRHAFAFDGMYEMLAEDEELVEWKPEDLVPKVFGIPDSELSVAGWLALDRFVAEKSHGIFSSKTEGVSVAYWVRSREDTRMEKQVMDWARMYQQSAAEAALGKDVKGDLRMNPLTAFINKAHRLILKSREIRSPTTVGVLGPSAESVEGGIISAVDTEETLTRNDKLIVRVIFEASLMVPPLLSNEARSICALIYRAIGAYPNLPLGKKVARLLLQELGVLSPWECRDVSRYHLRLPGLRIWPYQARLLAKAEASCKDLNVFRTSDQYARKDWGRTPVYCIDSSDTVEVDDGISVERDTKMADCAWIHVHIANPAAYISPEHPIAVAARDIVSSFYTPSKKYCMMPPTFAQALSSLAADRPVMTVSTLLRADGSVADIDLSLGIVRNVIRLTPTAVECALKEKRRDRATMVIGGARPAPKDDEQESQNLKKALPDLLLLRQFLHRRFRKRLDEWPVEQLIKRESFVPRAEAWTSLRDRQSPLPIDKLTHWKGDPIIVVEGDRFALRDDDSDAILLVDHVMLLAGESAAKWCKDKNIPILFHVATPHPLFPVSKLNQLQASDHKREPTGRISLTPKPHYTLHMWQYTKITSPIRRYPDLVNQWQIQAYLQAISHMSHDLNHARSLDPLGDLPFSQQELEKMTIPVQARFWMIKRAANYSRETCIQQALLRAFHFKEAELPEVWDCKVSTTWHQFADSTTTIGVLIPFNLTAEVLASEEKWEKAAQKGQFLPVKIEVVEIELGRVFVKAVGPPSDSVNTTQPIHIRSSRLSISATKDGPPQQR